MKLSLKKKDKVRFVLPTTYTEPCSDLSDYSIWLYGGPGIGKTTLTQQFEELLHVMFEPGRKALRVRCIEPKKWEHVDKWVDQIEEDESFKNVSIDTVEAMYDVCWRWASKKHDWEHPSDLPYGKGWDSVRSPFMKMLKRILGLPDKGAVLVSHAVNNTRTTKDGDEIDDIHPNLSGKMLEDVAGAVDLVGYYHIHRGEHVLQIRQTDSVFAKCRLEDNFNYTDGSRITYVPMGESKEEAYSNLIAAFNNELDRPKRKEKKTKLKKRRK